MKLSHSIRAAAALSGIIAPNSLDYTSQDSVRNVAATIAHEAMSYYNGNVTDPNSREYGNVQQPYYWWVAGALWGCMLDYYHYTTDPSYNNVVLQALLAPVNLGPNQDYQPPDHADEEGNDDLFFWGSAVLNAAERNFPQPNPNVGSWLDLASNVFNELVGRWDTKYCGGGLFWQILASNPNGMTYKNSVSNGGFFQLSARLARATGNNTYLEWAEKIWDWNAKVGFIDNSTYRVYDGASINSGCMAVNNKSFSYTTGIFLYGAAVMANNTGDDLWTQRATKLLDEAGVYFFTGNDKNIMYEPACEPSENCNYDQVTFKGYLSRFMWQTARLLPALRPKIESLMITSAMAAASICTGPDDGHHCGMKWYTGQFDYATLGGQMGALEAIQGLLSSLAPAPLKGDDIKWVKNATFQPIDTYADSGPTEQANSTTTAPAPSPTTSEESAATAGSANKLAFLGVAGLAAWALV